MRKWYMVLTVALFLTGCYSFNQITIPEGTKANDIRIARLITDGVTKDMIAATVPTPPAVVASADFCSTYVMPELPKTPELPYKELAKATNSDPTELDEIQSKHIAELRLYIAKMKKDLQVSYNDYLKKCKGQPVKNGN